MEVLAHRVVDLGWVLREEVVEQTLGLIEMRAIAGRLPEQETRLAACVRIEPLTIPAECLERLPRAAAQSEVGLLVSRDFAVGRRAPVRAGS